MPAVFWVLLILLVPLLAAFLYWQNSSLTVSQYEIPLDGLPEAFDGCRIVQLSDLHNKRFGKRQKRLLARVAACKPDYIMLTGDLADKRRTRDERFLPARELCEGLIRIAPVFAAMGNHETEKKRVEKMSAVLQSCGAVVLVDKMAFLQRNGASLPVIGLADIAVSEKRFGNRQGSFTHCAVLKELYRGAGEGCAILLSHRPHLVPIYRAAGVPLVLSGHAHGGQIRLPLVGGLLAPEQGLFPKYTSGMHKIGDVTLIISRGLGNSLFPFRIFNRPEVVCLRLVRKNDLFFHTSHVGYEEHRVCPFRGRRSGCHQQKPRNSKERPITQASS